MAVERRKLYQTNGAAAYDIYAMPEYDSNAARKRAPLELPKEKAGRQAEQKVKAKLHITPFTIVGVAAVVLVLAMVMVGYVRLYEAKNLTSDLKAELSAAKQEHVRLSSQHDNLVDYDDVALYAASHGMQQPTHSQTVYVSVPQKDVAVIESYDQRNILEQAWQTLRDGFSGVVEYLF